MLILLMAFCIVTDVVRELCFKMGARASVEIAPGAGYWASHLNAPLLWSSAGAAIWGIEILGRALVLAYLPLNVAVPVMSLTYAATPLASWLLLDDKISQRRWLGIALVTLGVMIVGTTGMV